MKFNACFLHYFKYALKPPNTYVVTEESGDNDWGESHKWPYSDADQ